MKWRHVHSKSGQRSPACDSHVVLCIWRVTEYTLITHRLNALQIHKAQQVSVSQAVRPPTAGTEVACNLLDTSVSSVTAVTAAVAELAAEAGLALGAEVYVLGTTRKQLLQQELEDRGPC